MEYPEPPFKSSWSNKYSAYRLILWSTMMNDMSIAFAPAEIAHSIFYIQAVIYTLCVIFIGIPLVYLEICITQYTNCDVISMWDYFPLFRSFGYGSILILLYKTICIITLASWYLVYTFYAAVSPPPWFSCDDFPDCKCIVKRRNISLFQHCIETQMLFSDDCGIKTASNCFFESEIGTKITNNSIKCMIYWKPITAAFAIMVAIYLLALKKTQFLLYGVKFLIVYMGVVIVSFCCIAFTTGGHWFSPGTSDSAFEFPALARTINRSFLSLGTGTGIIIHISRDLPFRSPATMTSIITSLVSTCACILFSLVSFSGIMIMSYYHGQEERILEMGLSIFFEQFASMSEIISYFDEKTIWGFAWFSAVLLCLLIYFWILFLLLCRLIVKNIPIAEKYYKLICFFVIILILIISCPFFCSDLNAALADATEVCQLINCFAMSLSLYWIYGFNKHANDITFMIGVKSSYYWKTAWIISPLCILFLIYSKISFLNINEFDDDWQIESSSIPFDHITFYVLLSIYGAVVLIGMFIEFFRYFGAGCVAKLFVPLESWGPSDKILFRSREMFIPQIMTTEFLYRQVRIYGYTHSRKPGRQSIKRDSKSTSTELSSNSKQWNALTSN